MTAETWAASSRAEGAFVAVQVRHGQVGSRALLGSLIMRGDEWRDFAEFADFAGWDVTDHRAEPPPICICGPQPTNGQVQRVGCPVHPTLATS